MRVAALEIPASFDRVEDNLALAEALLGRAPCDLALLPEASLTGYVSPGRDFDLTRFAEPREGSTAHALADLAKKHATHLVGPLIERDGDCIYNAMVGFDREGREFLHYRKRHPWYPETWATPGAAPHPVVLVDGMRVTIAICFDIHFSIELPPADVLLFPSAWVEEEDRESRSAAHHRDRADMLGKLGTHVVNANWGVGAPRMPGQGGSCILHASGAMLARCESGGRVDAELVRYVEAS